MVVTIAYLSNKFGYKERAFIFIFLINANQFSGKVYNQQLTLGNSKLFGQKAGNRKQG